MKKRIRKKRNINIYQTKNKEKRTELHVIIF